ncbi:MAG: hypothetical protein KKE39_02710 [Bacteroidetes bacterium]|nr:hypothetical protein [Bacteroidota bacterium]MBU1372243.1 hypothetical protein [Bacteroidota bacterium]MBU1484494.1 hypothetical protein [Bacteroidota bacterium]MBU1759714.1 hypothetical protein [Bacteroidota bacterium]MBU2375204.1 hypothetical protein [Bacteroidota bacterium]
MEQYIQRSLLDSTALRQISKDSLSWEQEQWRNLWVFADSLHPPMLVQEHVKSHAFQQGSQLTQQQSYQVRHDRLDRKEKELSYPPTKSWKWVQWLGILLLGLFLYFCWRRLKSI